MKALLRITTLSLLLGIVAAAIPAGATTIGTLYSNGPAHPNDPNAWSINFGYTVASSFYLGSASTVTGFEIGTWVPHYAGGESGPIAVDYSISSVPFGGTVFASGTVNLTSTLLWNTTASFCGSWGSCDVFSSIASLSGVALATGTYYLNLQNIVVPNGDPAFWDENGGVGCTGWNNTGAGCPSTAFGVGIPPGTSLDPDIYGYSNSEAPEPGSLTLFGSGILGVAAIVRRRFVA